MMTCPLGCEERIMSIESLVRHLGVVEDPRCQGKIEHHLIDILVIAVCAGIACAESWDDIALYGRSKLGWLRTFLDLPNGIPSHDGFGAQFGWWAQSGSLDALSGDALRHRHAEPGHPVQHRAADPGFGLLGRQSPGAQAATDDSFVAEHGSLPKRAPAVADRLLPAQAPLVPDHLDVLVPLTGRGPGSRAQRCGGPRRDDHRHRWVGLALSHGPVNGLVVIGPVRDHRGKGTGDLVEQGADLGGIPLLVARQLGREDLAGAGINGQMKLAPGPLAPRTVLLDPPLAGAVDLQAGRVDQRRARLRASVRT